jgi:hypothetical protein
MAEANRTAGKAANTTIRSIIPRNLTSSSAQRQHPGAVRRDEGDKKLAGCG